MTTVTMYCHNCGVALTEPSAFCSSCGVVLEEQERSQSSTPSQKAPDPSPPTSAMPVGGAPPPAGPVQAAANGREGSGSPRWVPLAVGGAVVLVAAVIAILLVTLGGSAGSNVKNASATREQALKLLAANGTTTVSSAAPGLYALVKTGKLLATVPAGWRATSQAANGTTRAEFADPVHRGSTLTIVTEAGGTSSDHVRAGSAERAVRQRGLGVTSYGPVTFPGGRTVWHVVYTDAGVTHATYFFSACERKNAMVVDVAASSALFTKEEEKLESVAAGAEPVC